MLLPDLEMRATPLTTSQMFAVVPRVFYVQSLVEDDADHRARIVLRNFVDDDRRAPPPARVADALRRLEASVACVDPDDSRRLRVIESAGFVNARRVGPLLCLDPPGA
jgi:hypothetical protein